MLGAILIIIFVLAMAFAAWIMWTLGKSTLKTRNDYDPIYERALRIKTVEEYDLVVEEAVEWQKQVFHKSQHGMVSELKGIFKVKAFELNIKTK